MIAFIRMAVDSAIQQARASGGTDIVVQLLPEDMQNLLVRAGDPSTYFGVPVETTDAVSQIAYHLQSDLLTLPLTLVAAHLM